MKFPNFNRSKGSTNGRKLALVVDNEDTINHAIEGAGSHTTGGELDHGALKMILIVVQVCLCACGAYLIASGYLGEGDPRITSWLSQNAQRGIGMTMFLAGSALWFFEDYI